ncbi:glycosyl transferase family 90-domain-containing protein [Mycena amicta]|nr:glycosyl transferase family 90-domain-containing protein [Mycena amicta]
MATPAPSTSSTPIPNPDTTLRAFAAAPVDALLLRQSTTLSQASARYTLRTNRPPPASYDQWFHYAREKRCLIDEYDQVHSDFKVFYDIAKEDRGYFRRRVERAVQQVSSPLESLRLQLTRTDQTQHKDSEISRADIHFGYFSKIIPKTTFLVNGRDEPRVAFNYRAADAAKRIQYFDPGPESVESSKFALVSHPTEAWFAQQGCEVPLEQEGLMKIMLSAVKGAFTTQLYPMLSMAKVSPCFADILFPTEARYSCIPRRPTQRVRFFPSLLPPLYPSSFIADWRGGATNGLILPNSTTYHSFPRFRLYSLSQSHPSLLDARITTFSPKTHCFPPGSCNAKAIMSEYNIAGTRTPREGVYEYKYVVDVDGATFSGRFWELLRSGSLVFKSTIFSEFFNSWVRPNEHYIAVLPDLSDLIQKIEWANANPEEARLIQLRGLDVAQRVLSDAQNDCYFANVLMHWEELMSFGDSEAQGGLEMEEVVVVGEVT